MNFEKLVSRTKPNQRKVLRSVCGSGYPCAAGDARTSADWLHLRDALRGRCTGCDARTSADWLHLRDALRGRCTGCDARTSADWLHLSDVLRCRCTGCDALTSADWLHLRDALQRARWLLLQAQAAPCFWRIYKASGFRL